MINLTEQVTKGTTITNIDFISGNKNTYEVIADIPVDGTTKRGYATITITNTEDAAVVADSLAKWGYDTVTMESLTL